MRIEFFIALRYFLARRRLNFITIISYLSFGGITIGVAALIVVLSVYNGFSTLVSTMLISLDPQICIEANNTTGQAGMNDLLTSLRKNHPDIPMSPYISGKVLIFHRGTYQIINYKGVETASLVSVYNLNEYIFDGKKIFPGTTDENFFYAGQPMASGFGIEPGDTVAFISPKNLESAYLYGSLPNVNKSVLSGVYMSQNNYYDIACVMGDLASAQSLFGYNDSFEGIDIHLTDVNTSEKTAELLRSEINQSDYSVKTWFDLHKELFTVMRIERIAAFVLLSLIILVAVFNILASLAMSVMEKKREIGILQAMGLQPDAIRRVFLIQGAIAGVAGTILGSMLGVFLYWLQVTYKIYPLDPTRFKIDAMPMQLNFIDFITVSAAAICLSLLAALFPAARAAKINALEAIRWE
ncbi:MAG: ABC transporter permease [Ignavibacteria bacterium]|nr:ABC transporter permease [Ignavibacteria bacterium]